MSASLPPAFADALAHLAARGRATTLAAKVLWFDSVDSTNTVAQQLARADEPEGTIVVAGGQTAGRGRRGRAWVSPVGTGVYASVVLRPTQPMPLLTLAAGVATADGIAGATEVACDLKWPNDLLVRGRKVAGLLAEAGVSPRGQYVVLGIGINVRTATFTPELDARTTTLEAECGWPVEPGVVFAEVVAALSTAYTTLSAGQRAAVLRAWRVRARPTLGREVEWDSLGERQTGVAADVDETGALVVQTETGRRTAVTGEVRWR